MKLLFHFKVFGRKGKSKHKKLNSNWANVAHIRGYQYNKSNVRNQSIILKYLFSPMVPQRG
jgi:hypothetical protein